MDRTDDRITLCKIKFNLGTCKHLTEDEINSLSDTAKNVFYFIQAFEIKLKLRWFVNIWMVEDRLQDLYSSTLVSFRYTFMKTCLIQIKIAKSKTKQS